MHNTEIPIVMRQTLKCARLFFKLVDFKKLALHYPSSALAQLISNVETNNGDTPNQFLVETLLKIGQKVSNTLPASEKSQVKKEECE